MTRMTGLEQPLPGPALEIFIKNTWNALTMFFWDNGEIWVHSVMDRPALDLISAAIFFIGVVLLIMRYFRKHDWLGYFLVDLDPFVDDAINFVTGISS